MAKTLLPDGSAKYNGGGFSVTVKPDGAISVQPGDSISKYSMAIHGNFNFLNEYKHRRQKPNGPITDSDLQELPNINLINAGEILYHMPTRDTSSIPSPVDPNPIDAGKPKPFPRENLNGLKINYNERLFVDINIAPLQAGQSWKASDGRRTILMVSSAAASLVFLLEKPGHPDHLMVFAQNGSAFYLDVKNAYVDDLARRLEPLKAAIELELVLMLGFVSCLSMPAFVIVSGVSLLEWTVNNWSWLTKVGDALRVTYKVHTFLKTHAPVLYKKMIVGLFHGVIDQVPGVVGNIPQAIINNPKLVVGAVGVFLGKLAAFEKGKMLGFAVRNRFAAAFLIVSLLLGIVAKALLAVPGAVVLTAVEKAEYAKDIVKNLRDQGVPIDEAEANAIIDEVLANPQLLKSHLEELKAAFAAVQ
ncbi:MAG: hypothetical protein R2681_01365 [Pyrinomonadaceae bacterium]